ncbi:hypothetical protein [uncultured Aeromicrobium sp.]|uniref:hypothetical protein n=1 Tax=uncultured Aeromicrobium sp. TaxID=337820 RepID=UPI0025E8BBC4|nr:hypothetical protein [uncultured Aeromicrobium sp.]
MENDEEATSLLHDYAEILTLLEERDAQDNQPGEAGEALNALADYANHYDLMAAMEVPLDEPFLVKFSERRSLRLDSITNSGSQDLIIADAQTNHVTFKVADPNVQITSFTALRAGSAEAAFGAFESRSDRQHRAFYAHGGDRDYHIRLRFRLALLRRLQLVPYAAAILLLLLTSAMLHEQLGDLRELAVVAAPAALGASVLLVREPSTLGSRLRSASSFVLGFALLLLLAAAVWLYVQG